MNMKKIVVLSIMLTVLVCGAAFAGGSSESEALTTVSDIQSALLDAGTAEDALSDEELASLADILGLEGFSDGSSFDYAAVAAGIEDAELTDEELASLASILGLVEFGGANVTYTGAASLDAPGAQTHYQHELHAAVGVDSGIGTVTETEPDSEEGTDLTQVPSPPVHEHAAPPAQASPGAPAAGTHGHGSH